MQPAQIMIESDIPKENILSRYMDLPKLLDLLHTRSLYFRRADGFSDRLEGALFPSLRRSLDEEFARKEVHYDADHFYRRARMGNYVSCWTVGDRDNMALWQLYGGVKTSIAVTTTGGRLVKCASDWNRSTYLRKVIYVDHCQVPNYIIGDFAHVLQYKSDAYKYERELRVIVPQQDDGWEQNPIGIWLALPNINALVRSVVVAPEADPSFLEAVRGLCKRYDLKAPVKLSKLSQVPV